MRGSCGQPYIVPLLIHHPVVWEPSLDDHPRVRHEHRVNSGESTLRTVGTLNYIGKGRMLFSSTQLNPKPKTLHPKPKTQNPETPKPKTLNP